MEPDQRLTRATRLAHIQHCLYENPHGLTSRELAGLCGASVRTIQRDLLTLQAELRVPMTEEGHRYAIVDGYILPPVSFTLHEAMALFLATRLVLRQADEANPHVGGALSKLAGALPIELGRRLEESLKALSARPPNPRYVDVFEKVAIAWAAGRRLRISYQSLQSAEGKEWLLDPYFVETTGVGHSAYVIGHAERGEHNGLTTFKLGRILQADLLDESFSVPDGLALSGLLHTAWGIMWGEETEVRLRFSAGVSRRVKESLWHPGQRIEDLADGGCLYVVRVGSVLEMTPWIRSWGPEVEVLAPASLREQLRGWAAGLHRLYGELPASGGIIHQNPQ